MSVETLHTRLAANAHPVQYPIGAEGNFNGIVDLVKMEAWQYEADAKRSDKNTNS